MYKLIAKGIELFTNGLYKILSVFLSEQFLSNWKPIHLCWWFKSHNLVIPRYFIGTDVESSNNKDLFSETFELNNLNRWTIVNDSVSTAATSNTFAKSGIYSCKIEYKQDSTYSLIRKILASAKTNLYIKFWLYLPSGYTQPDTNLSLFDIKNDSWGMEFETFLHVSGSNLVISYTRTGGDAANVITSITIPRGKWTCLEFHVVKSATAGSVDIFLNGDNGYSASSLNTGSGNLYIIEFGSGWTDSAMIGSPLYYDDIEIAENRIGTTVLRGALSFTFDDGESGVYTYARDIFKNANLTATSFIITDWVGGTSYMTSAQIKTLYSDGWEIGSHTVDHTDLTTLNDTDLTNELADSKSYLESLGITVYSCAAPSGAYNNVVLAKIAKYYINHRTANDSQNESLPTDNYLLGIMGIYGTTTPATVKGWIDNTIASGQKLILCLHNVVASSPTTYEIASADLQTIVSYFSGKQIDVLTMKDLVKSMGS